MLFLLFNYRYCLGNLVKCLVAPTVETQNRCLFEQPKLLTIVVIDVKFLLDFLHFLEVGGKVWILCRFQQLPQFFSIALLLL